MTAAPKAQRRPSAPLPAAAPRPDGPSWELGPRTGWIVATVLGATFGLHRLIDPDLFLQIAVGRSILAQPSSLGISSFIAAYPSHPYVEDKWLASVIAAIVDAGGGVDGLMVYQITLCALVAAAWYFMQRAWSASPTMAVLGITLALVTCAFRLEPRPDTMSHGLLALIIGLSASPLPFRRLRWVVPLVLLVWVNLHGYFINGLLVLLAAAVAHAGGDRDLPRARGQERLILLGLATLACLIHPQGWHALTSPLSQLGQLNAEPALRAAIQEFTPSTALLANMGPIRFGGLMIGVLGSIGFALGTAQPSPLLRQLFALAIAVPWLWWPPSELSSPSYRLSFALLIMAMVEVPLALRAARLFRPALLAGFTILAAPMVRNIPLIVPAALVLLTPAWTAAAVEVARRSPRFRPRVVVPATVLLVAVAVGWLRLADRWGTDVRAPSRTGWGVDAERFPVGAVDFLLAEGPAGPLLNNFDSGGYLLYRIHPSRQVFIAGNTSMYPPSFLAYYRASVSGSALDLRNVSARYAPSSVVLDLTSPAAARLATALASDDAWRLAFFDRGGAVFVHSSDRAREPLDVTGRARALLMQMSAAPVLPPWLGGKPLAYPSFNLGLFLSAIGRPDLTVDEAARLWPLAPSEDVAVLGGKAAQLSQRLMDFLPPLEQAVHRYPESEAVRTLLFFALATRADRRLNDGALAAAEEDLRRMLALQPQACGPYFALAKAAVLQRNAAAAASLLAQGRRYDRDGTCARGAAADASLAPLLRP